MSQDATLQPVATKLTDLDAKITHAASATARKNTMLLILAVLLSAGVAGYLYWMYSTIDDAITPQNLAEGARGKLAEVIETNGPTLGTRLAEFAPDAVAQLETQVKLLPPKMSAQFRERTSAELAKHMPELEKTLEESIRAGLAQADAKLAEMPGKTDEERIKALLETMAQVYGDQTIQAVDEFTAKYKNGAKDILDHLAFLAEGQGLDQEMKLQREIMVKFITLADHYQQNSGKVDPMSTSITSPKAAIPGTR